jgi:hypothetical protein
MVKNEPLEIVLDDVSGKVHAADLSYNDFFYAYQYALEI